MLFRWLSGGWGGGGMSLNNEGIVVFIFVRSEAWVPTQLLG